MSSLREQFNAEAHAVPALGDIDAALAQVAKERRRLRRVGTAAVAAVVLIGWLVTRPEVGATPPPASTFTPTPTASPAFIPVSRAPEVIPPLPAARFALEDPVVRADPGHHSAWVVATLRNDSEHRLFIGGQFLPITGGDYVQRDSADPYLPVVGEPVSTADGLAARDGTLEDVRAILDRYQRGVGQPTAAPGGRIAVIMRVTSACTASPPPLRGFIGAYAYATQDLQGAPEEVMLVNLSGPTSGWLTAALAAACGPTPSTP